MVLPMDSPTSAKIRRSDRIRTKIPVTVLLDPQAHMILHHTYTVDVSKFGMRLLANFKLSPGQEVEVTSTAYPRYVFRSRVVWVRITNGNEAFEAGLEFLNPLPV
jgi:hypothetical protein